MADKTAHQSTRSGTVTILRPRVRGWSSGETNAKGRAQYEKHLHVLRHESER